MADILIRGMEMPKTCCQCDIKIYDPEKRWDENGIERIGAWVCKRTREIIWNTKRGDNCPLAPLPEGHGRLGDLDRLFEVMGQDADRWIVDEVSMIETDDVLDAIQNAPTIIEADLEWKMKNCCCFSNTDQAEGGGEDG